MSPNVNYRSTIGLAGRCDHRHSPVHADNAGGGSSMQNATLHPQDTRIFGDFTAKFNDAW